MNTLSNQSTKRAPGAPRELGLARLAERATRLSCAVAALGLVVLSGCKLAQVDEPKRKRAPAECTNCEDPPVPTPTPTTTPRPTTDLWFQNGEPAVAVAGAPYTLRLKVNLARVDVTSVQLFVKRGSQLASIGTCAGLTESSGTTFCTLAYTPTASDIGARLAITGKIRKRSGELLDRGYFELAVVDGIEPGYSIELAAPPKNANDLAVPAVPGDTIPLTVTLVRRGGYSAPVTLYYEYSGGAGYQSIDACSGARVSGGTHSCAFKVPDPLIVDDTFRLRFRVRAIAEGSLTFSNERELAALDPNLSAKVLALGSMKDRGEAIEIPVDVARSGSAQTGTAVVYYQYALGADGAPEWRDGAAPCALKTRGNASTPDRFVCRHVIGNADEVPYAKKAIRLRAIAKLDGRIATSPPEKIDVGSPLKIESFTLQNPDLALPEGNIKQFLGRTVSATVTALSSTGNNSPLKLTIRTQAGSSGVVDTDCKEREGSSVAPDSPPTLVTFSCTITLPNEHDAPDVGKPQQARWYIASVTQGAIADSSELVKKLQAVSALHPARGPFISVNTPVPHQPTEAHSDAWIDGRVAAGTTFSFLVGATQKVEIFFGTRDGTQCKNWQKQQEFTFSDATPRLRLVTLDAAKVTPLTTRSVRDADRTCIVGKAVKQAGQAADRDAGLRLRVQPTLYVHVDPVLPREQNGNTPIVPTTIRFGNDRAKEIRTWITPGIDEDGTEGARWLRDQMRKNFGSASEPDTVKLTVARETKTAVGYASAASTPYCEIGCPAKLEEDEKQECYSYSEGFGNLRWGIRNRADTKRFSAKHTLNRPSPDVGRLRYVASVPKGLAAASPSGKINVVYRTCVAYDGNELVPALWTSGFNGQNSCSMVPGPRKCKWVDSSEPVELYFGP